LLARGRIAYIKVGRHVRIAEADLAGFVAAGRIEASA
jgi:excisionase family DNA binding protein